MKKYRLEIWNKHLNRYYTMMTSNNIEHISKSYYNKYYNETRRIICIEQKILIKDRGKS